MRSNSSASALHGGKTNNGNKPGAVPKYRGANNSGIRTASPSIAQTKKPVAKKSTTSSTQPR